MAHDDHFLSRLDRVSTSDCGLALELYRDDDMVRRILCAANIAGSPDRIAIALRSGERPPHVIVAGDGHFVTCLAEGMSTGGRPVITYEKLEAISVALRDVRSRLNAHKNGSSMAELLCRIFLAGDAMSREDYLILYTLKDAYAPHFREFAFDGWQGLIRLVPRTWEFRTRRPVHDQLALWRAVWGQANLLPLTVSSDFERIRTSNAGVVPVHFGTLEQAISGLGTSVVGLRALWAACADAKVAFCRGATRYIGCTCDEDFVTSILLLIGAACRDPILHDEAISIFANPPGFSPQWAERYSLLKETIDRALARDPAQRAATRRLAHDTLVRVSSPRAVAEFHLDDERDAEPMLVAALLHGSTRMSAGVSDMLRLIPITALLVSAKPEELYFPKAFLEANHVRYQHSKLVALLDRMSACAPKRIAERSSRPGPNDACSCGSGQKSKRCCGNATRRRAA